MTNDQTDDKKNRAEIYELFDSLKRSEHDVIDERLRHQLNYREFISTGNGVYAMSACNQCCRLDLPLPTWLKAWLVTGFNEYMLSQDDNKKLSDLGRCLGVVTQTKKSQPKPFDALDKQRQIDDMLYKAHLMVCTYKFTIKMACELVWCKQKTNLHWRVTPNTHTQLAKKYSENEYSKKPINFHNASANEHSWLLENYITIGLSQESKTVVSNLIERLTKVTHSADLPNSFFVG